MLLLSNLFDTDGDLLVLARQRSIAYSIVAQHGIGFILALAGCFITPLGGWKVSVLTVSFVLHWWGRIRLDRLKDETKVFADVLNARDFARVDGIEAVMQAQLVSLSAQLQGQAPQGQLLLPPAEPPMSLFDWNELRSQPNKHPHLLVLGESGSGKTELGEWLVDLIGGGFDVKVLTTKQRHFQWRGMPVVGVGRDFAAIERDLQGLLGEMTERSRDIDAVEQKPVLVRAIDELPAIAENTIGAADPKTGKYKGLATYTKPLVLEARETRIRLILHAQGKQVKLLGFEGISDCLDSLTHIRLGEAALKHAKTLSRQKELSDEAYGWLKQQERPILVGDIPASFPIPTSWQPSGNYARSSVREPDRTDLEPLSKADCLDALFGKNPFPEPGDKNYLKLMKELFPEMTAEQQNQFISWGQSSGNLDNLPGSLPGPQKLPQEEPSHSSDNLPQVSPDKRSSFRELGNLSYPDIPLEQRIALFKTILPFLKQDVTLTDLVKVHLHLEGKYYTQTATLCRALIAEFWTT